MTKYGTSNSRLFIFAACSEVPYIDVENGCPETQSCANNTLPISPEAQPAALTVSGTRIVWEDDRAGHQQRQNDIYVYDLATGLEEPVTDEPGNQIHPAIDGDWVVWVHEDDYHSGSPSINDLFARNLATQEVVQLTADGGSVRQGQPAISQTLVAYDQPGGISVFDLDEPGAGSRQISSQEGSYTDISADKVVWRSSSRVMLCDLSTGVVQEVTDGLASVYHPAVSGKRIVWTDARGPQRNIYTTRMLNRLSYYWALMGTDTCCGQAGDPVNTATGAFFYEHTDVDIPTKGLPLSIVRTYNSNDQQDGPFGYGWSFNWQMDARVESDGDVIIRRGDGRRDTFTNNGDGTYSAPSGRHDVLAQSQDTDISYTLTTIDQVEYAFNNDNLLASVTTDAGQTTTLTYNGQQLATITGPAGRDIRLTYNAEGHIESAAYDNGPDTYSLTYSYSQEGNLTQVTDQIGGHTTYTYDDHHRM